MIDLERDGRSVTVARSIKPSSELGKARTVEKLEIERRYWDTRGIDWGLVTERELPPVLLRNLELLQACTSLDVLNQPFEGYYRERDALIDAELENWPQDILQQFCQAMDTRLRLEPGGTLLLVRHLLAAKIWRTDLTQPITDKMPMKAFHRYDGVAQQRVRA